MLRSAARLAGRHAAPPAAAILALAAAGCHDPLARIDRATQRLLVERAAALGPEVPAPDRRRLDRLRGYESPTMDRKAPPTVNPPADALGFDGVDDQLRSDRAVAERLQAYAENAFGQGPDPDGAEALPVLEIGLPDAFRYAQRTGSPFLAAEEAYILAALDVLFQRRLFDVRFFNTTSAEISGFGDDGNFQHALNVINTLSATRQFETGGAVSASWIVSATDQLREEVAGFAGPTFLQTSSIELAAEFPLLRGAGRVASEGLISAERDLVYAAREFERTRREILVDVAGDYFALVELQNNIDNQLRNIEGLRLNREATQARVEAGRASPFQAQLSENALLTAESALASIRETYILAVDNFKISLGIPIEVPVEILPLDFELEEPATSQAEAALAAVTYRLDLQTERDQLDDARRAIRNARNGLLPDLDLAGSIGIPTDVGDPTGGLGFDPGDFDYTLSATLGLPLDRRLEKIELRTAIIGLEAAVRTFDDFRDSVIVSARQSVREIDLARFQLELAEAAVRINELRLEDLRLRDDVDPQSVVDAEDDLVEARNARDAARTDLRNAVLDYLLTTGQLRVARDGTFIPPGTDRPTDQPDGPPPPAPPPPPAADLGEPAS